MIKGFEEYTAELNEDQLNDAREVWRFLNKNQEQFFTNTQLAEAMRKKIQPAVMRKMISHIRIMMAQQTEQKAVPCIIATSEGYKMTTDPKPMYDYLISIKQRLSAIQLIHNATYVIHKRMIQELNLDHQTTMRELYGQTEEE